MDPVYRTLTLRGATGKLRAARLQDKDYLVVPVTALVEAVIHPLGSKGRGEFVSRQVLQQSTEAWNGRPVVPDHPMDAHGQLVSANLPTVFETQAFGMTFNAAFKHDRELHMEAWLDPARAEVVGAEAVEVIRKVRAEQPVEVSVGGYVRYVEEPGTHDGQEYGVEWLQIISDHLAIGLHGARGACSVEMGCGAMRGNATPPSAATPIYVLTPDASGARLVAAGTWQAQPRISAGLPGAGQWAIDNPMSTPQVAPLSPFEQWRATVKTFLKSFVRTNMRPEDMSDDDLREGLQTAVSANKSGYWQVARVYPKRQQVVFVHNAAPEETADLQWYQQDYSLSAEGAVALTGEAAKVRPVHAFETLPVAPDPVDENPVPETPPATPVGACGCQNANEEPQMHRNADKIQALIDNPKTPFTADDTPFLEGLTDDRLAGFTPPGDPPAPVAVPAPVPVPVPVPVIHAAPEPKALTAAELAASLSALNDTEFIAALPEEARALVVAGRAVAKERREKLLAGLQAATKDAYAADELAAMGNDQLTKLAKAVGFDPEQPEAPPVEEARGARVFDWSGMGGARRAPEGQDLKDFTPPDPWAAALTARKGA